MTKVLYVLRHAQSAGKQSGQRDYDRNLTPDGEAKAEALGKKLKEMDCTIHLILSSGATRAMQTVTAVNKSLLIPAQKIQFEDELYEAMVQQWMDHIHGLSDDLSHVMVVGHNPWLSMLASHFSENVVELNPGELIAFRFSVESWKEIDSLAKEILNIA